jgi:hypothetical protein
MVAAPGPVIAMPVTVSLVVPVLLMLNVPNCCSPGRPPGKKVVPP